MMNEVLPWLNVLLFPMIALLISINGRLASLEATQKHHGGRLKKIDGIEA